MNSHLNSIRIFVLLSGFLAAVPCRAETFKNSFIQFDLLPSWSCALDGSTWTCQTSQKTLEADAVMVLAAKKKGDQDTMASFQGHLGEMRKLRNPDGSETSSKLNYVKQTTINGQLWVDALHDSSEMKGYFTRYLATIHNDIAVLITYSIEKSKYQQYQSDLDNLIRSVKIAAQAPALASKAGVPAGGPQGVPQGLGATSGAVAGKPGSILSGSADAPVAKIKTESGGGGGSAMSTLLLLLIVGGGGAFFIYKKKKSQQVPPS